MPETFPTTGTREIGIVNNNRRAVAPLQGHSRSSSRSTAHPQLLPRAGEYSGCHSTCILVGCPYCPRSIPQTDANLPRCWWGILFFFGSLPPWKESLFSFLELLSWLMCDFSMFLTRHQPKPYCSLVHTQKSYKAPGTQSSPFRRRWSYERWGFPAEEIPLADSRALNPAQRATPSHPVSA